MQLTINKRKINIESKNKKLSPQPWPYYFCLDDQDNNDNNDNNDNKCV